MKHIITTDKRITQHQSVSAVVQELTHLAGFRKTCSLTLRCASYPSIEYETFYHILEYLIILAVSVI